MGDKVMVSGTGFVPSVEFIAHVQGKVSFFRAVSLDSNGVVLFSLVQPAPVAPKVKSRSISSFNVDPEVIHRAKAMRRDGATLAHIAEAMSTSTGTVYRWTQAEE